MSESHLGRREAEEALGALVEGARAGRGGAVVVSGVPGIGKSALLRHALGDLDGVRMLRASGVEFEMELAYAAVHQLCAPLLDCLGALPPPQRAALEVVLGQREGGRPDRFGVALAVLSLLSEAAGSAPLVCVVDDAHWLDWASAQLLAFVARRIEAEPIALVFALREPADVPALADLPGLPLAPLGAKDARALLERDVRAPRDARVRDRILAEAAGNPLALLEFPHGAGALGLPAPASLTSRIERSFSERAGQLPEATRLLLLTAAAEPLGDAGLLWRAADLLGIEPSAAGPAEAAELIELGPRARFRHPLVRSAVYRAASPAERRGAHRALAEATDPRTDPDRRAWHAAQAASRPDEEVAAALVASADRAWARGGARDAAAFWEHAARLTPGPALRADRLLAGARAHLEASGFDAALQLIGAAEAGPLDERQRARADVLRGRSAFFQDGATEAVGHLVAAARRIAPHDPAAARSHLLDALQAGLATGRGGDAARSAVRAAREAPPMAAAREAETGEHVGQVTYAEGELLDAVLGYLDGRPGSVSVLRRLLDGMSDALWARRLALASLLAFDLWDTGPLRAMADRRIEEATEQGTLVMLPVALEMRATDAVLRGETVRGAAALCEAETAAAATGAAPLWYAHLQLSALRGRRDEAADSVEAAVREAAERNKPLLAAFAEASSALLANGLADYPAALAAARRAVRHEDLTAAGLALPELVEAAVRCGETGTATAALRTLTARTAAADTPWARGIQAYAEALLAPPDEAGGRHRAAVEQLAASGMHVWLARAHLVHGEWLRREGRRREARAELRLAHERFAAMDAEGFAERARTELAATGERPRGAEAPGGADALDSLTAQELNIARLVASGATSKETAARMFLSPRTVDAHLRSIFKKLDLTSRRQLRTLPLGTADATPFA